MPKLIRSNVRMNTHLTFPEHAEALEQAEHSRLFRLTRVD